MRLGLGLSLASVAGIGYDPAALALTGWWRTDYSASPWVGTASAGASGTRNLVNIVGSAPAAGAALNGRIPPDFDGTDDRVSIAVGMSTFLPAAGAGLAVLFNADSAAAAAANAGLDACLIAAESARRFDLAFNASGIRADIYNGDGSTWTQTAHTACSTGAWHWVFVWWDAIPKLYVQVDGGAVQETAITGAATPDTFNLRVGANLGLTAFFNGRIAEVMCKGSAWTAGDISNIRSYGSSRYGL